MTGHVAAGVDGSGASLAAADWAAREAARRGTPLKLVHAWEERSRRPAGKPAGKPAETDRREQAEQLLKTAEDTVRAAHPNLEIGSAQVSGSPVAVLLAAADEAEVLALGSRGISGIGGFLTGSVSLRTLGEAPRPVVLVRSGHTEEDEHEPQTSGLPSRTTPHRPVVVGLNLRHPAGELVEYAFAAANRSGAPLHAVHCWDYPPTYGTAVGSPGPLVASEMKVQERALADAVGPWRERYPEVEVTEEVVSGRAAHHLIKAAAGAGLVVVGRHVRRAAIGWNAGHVAHAVLHHVAAPVTVVPYR